MAHPTAGTETGEPLTKRFLASLPSETRALFERHPKFAEALQNKPEQAQQTWPDVALAPEEFLS